MGKRNNTIIISGIIVAFILGSFSSVTLVEGSPASDAALITALNEIRNAILGITPTQTVTVNSLVGPQGEDGPQGEQGPPGEVIGVYQIEEIRTIQAIHVQFDESTIFLNCDDGDKAISMSFSGKAGGEISVVSVAGDDSGTVTATNGIIFGASHAGTLVCADFEPAHVP